MLKSIFVSLQEYECTAYLRDIERELLSIEELKKFHENLNPDYNKPGGHKTLIKMFENTYDNNILTQIVYISKAIESKYPKSKKDAIPYISKIIRDNRIKSILD